MGGKKKVVVRVPCCVKGRSIAFSTVAGVPGVSSVSLEGAEKDRVAVTGEEIDPCGLMKSLKKKVRCVELLTVVPVEEKPQQTPQAKPQQTPQAKPQQTPQAKPIGSVVCFCQSVPCFCQTVPRLCRQEHVIYVCELCNPEPICVIM